MRSKNILALFFLFVLVLGGVANVESGEADTPEPPSLTGAKPPEVHPYPAIKGWISLNGGRLVGRLIRLIRNYNPRLTSEEVLTIVDGILGAYFRYDLDPVLVASVIAAESSFNPHARSHCGAQGLMQLTPGLQPWVGVSDPYDIRQNIAGGCRYLTALQKRFGRLDLALAAYNAGPTRVARLGRVPRIEETIRYLRRVERLRAELMAEMEDETVEVEGHPFVV